MELEDSDDYLTQVSEGCPSTGSLYKSFYTVNRTRVARQCLLDRSIFLFNNFLQKTFVGIG